MVELQGSLSGISLLSIFQLIGELHHSGTLQLDQGEVHALLAFDDGRLVGAECGAQHGVQALANCARELADGDFTFIEGNPILERTLDLGTIELKGLLGRVQNGEAVDTADLPTISGAATSELEIACRMLGFADDRDRHYSRPTALHRCYASGAQSLVSAQEQRDLCLSGRFAACPRYRNTELSQQPTVAVHESRPTVAVEEPPRVVSRVVASKPSVPLTVAPRKAALDPAPTTSTPPSTPANKPPIEVPPLPTVHPPRVNGVAPERKEEKPESRRGVLIAGATAFVGLVIVAAAALMVLPRLNQGPATQPAITPVAAPTLAVAAGAPPIAAAGAQATAVPTVARTALPTATTAARPTQTPVAVSPSAAASGNTLMDVRFAAGPVQGWVDNQPLAGWSDGAYRMQATREKNFVAIGVPIDRILGDIVVAGTFRKTGGPPGGGYGLIVRDQGPLPRDGENQQGNMYVLETGDLGEFGVWRRDGDHWVDLVPWTRSNVVRPGGSPNELMVRAVGNQLSFTVNGSELASVQDGTLLAGGVGVFVGGDYNEVALDRFSLQSPD